MGIDHLAEENCPAIPKLRDEASELVASVGLGDWLRTFRDDISRKGFQRIRGIEPRVIDPEFRCEGIVFPE